MEKQNKTILVLEDEKPLIEVIKAKLEAEGFKVVSARSVGQAVEYLKSGIKIDVVWLDHYLFGVGTGLNFAEKIKQKGSAWKDVPIFVVSNTVSPEKVQEYFKLGAIKFSTKVDFKLDEIIRDIKKFLATHKI
jgi:CheY-like chemotaxis protein